MPRFCRWLVVLLFVLPGCSSKEAAPGRTGTSQDGSPDNDRTSMPMETGAMPPTSEGGSIAEAGA
jgi:hypothetical protein